MAKTDLSNAFISSIRPSMLKRGKASFTSCFLSGLTLVVKSRKGADLSRIADDGDISKYYISVWRLRYSKADAGRSSIDLGFWPAMNQDAAVVAGRDVLLAVDEGRDLVKEKLAEKELIIPEVNVARVRTIAYLLEQFVAYRESRHPEKQSTTDYYKKQINNHLLPRWGLFSIDAISQWTWQEYIRDVKQQYSDNVARHCHATMRAALSFAVQAESFHFVKANVLLGLKVVSELKTAVRSRFFNNEELHKFMVELPGVNAPVTQKNIVLLQLYQGLRISEVLNIRLADLKTLNQSEIKVIVKGRREGHTILSRQAIGLIKSQMRHLISESSKSEWLFPYDRDASKNYATRQAGDFIKKLRKDWISFSSHDLRRTCRTWLGEFGCPKEMRDMICNHSIPTGKDASYDHADRKDEQLRWMQTWADRLDEICIDPSAFKMNAEMAIDSESANELEDLMSQLL